MISDTEDSVIVFDNKKVVGKFDNLYDAYNSLGEAIYDNYNDNLDHFLESYRIDYSVEHDDI